MIAAGMDLARLNFAHGSIDEHAETVEMVRAASQRAGREIGILQDIPGPKLRLGPVDNGVAELPVGGRLVLTLPQTLVGTTTLPLDLSAQPNGTYAVRVSDGSHTAYLRAVKAD